jgi:glutathione S-transferase
MKLYEFRRSRSMKCRWMVKEIGIDCEIEEVNLMEGKHYEPEFLAVNPAGKVPALVDGELKLHEAGAILFYLADKFPEKKLIPALNTTDRAMLTKWMFFMANDMECFLWNIEKNTWAYPEDKRSPDAIETSKFDFKKALKVLDAEIQGKDFLVANTFTIADISLTYLLGWGRLHNLLEETTNLESYYNRMIEKEHFPRELYN